MRTAADTGSSVWVSFMDAVDSFIRFLPQLLGAIILLAIGWLVAGAVGRLVVKGLHLVGFERAVQSTGIGQWINRMNPKWTGSRLLGDLVRWFVFLLFVLGAANLLSIPQVTHVVDEIILFIPQIVIAVAIVVVGAWLARFLGNTVRASLSRIDGVNPTLFARLTQYGVLGVAIIAAISQLGIAPFVVNSLFITLVASVGLAVGLAFGLGGRDVAGKITQRWYDQGQRMADRFNANRAGPTGALHTRAWTGIDNQDPLPPPPPRPAVRPDAR